MKGSRCPDLAEAMFDAANLGAQLLEQRFRVLQVGSVEALSEPVVNVEEYLTGFFFPSPVGATGAPCSSRLAAQVISPAGYGQCR